MMFIHPHETEKDAGNIYYSNSTSNKLYTILYWASILQQGRIRESS